MAEHKNQHYVSQFYLKNFSSDRKTIGTLILSSKKFIVKAFMLLQETRTKHSADIVHRGFNLMTIYLESRGISDEFKPNFEKLKVHSSDAIEIMKSMFQTSMNNCGDLTLKVIINKTKLPFITCDDPLITYNKHLERLEHNNYGLSCNGLILLLPISPTHILVLYDANIYKLGTRKQFYIPVSNIKDIEEICLLTILHASQTIYIKNGSIDYYQLTKLTNIAAKYIQSENMELESFSSDDGKGELLRSYSEHFHIGARLDFLKELDKAKGIKSINKRSFSVTQIMRPHCIKLLDQKQYRDPGLPFQGEQTFSTRIYSSREKQLNYHFKDNIHI